MQLYDGLEDKSHYHNVSRTNGIWQGSQIMRILEDERYTGTYIIGKRAVVEIGSTKSRLKPESEWVKIPDHHPAIISKDLYEQVKILMKRGKCPKTKRPDYPLKSKVICGCCLHVMQRVRKNDKAFICRFTLADLNAKCYRHEVGEQELENLLFEIINKQAQVILNADGLGDMSNLPLNIEQQSEYQIRIDAFREEKCKLYERYVLGEVNAEAYNVEKAAIDTELNRLNQAFNTLKAETAVMVASKTSDDELRHLAETAHNEVKLSKALMDLLIDKVYVYPDNRVEIDWKVGDFAPVAKEKEW